MRFYLHELACLSCGRDVALARTLERHAPVFVPRTLRCPACGGLPIPTGEIVRHEHRQQPVDLGEPPRLGRPPKKTPRRDVRTCTRCGETKPALYFYDAGGSNWCVRCHRDYRRQWDREHHRPKRRVRSEQVA